MCMQSIHLNYSLVINATFLYDNHLCNISTGKNAAVTETHHSGLMSVHVRM